MDPIQQPIVYTKSSIDNFFRKRYNTTVAFALGVLLFFLPFAQLKCGSVIIAENTGIGLASGSQWKITMIGDNTDLFKNINSSKSNGEREPIKTSPDWFLLLSLAMAAAGIILSISNWKTKSIATMSAGILAAVMLIAAIIYLKIMLKSQLPKGNKDDSFNLNMDGVVGIKFTIWYLISLAAFLAAALFGYKHHKNEMNDAIEKMVDFDFQQKTE